MLEDFQVGLTYCFCVDDAVSGSISHDPIPCLSVSDFFIGVIVGSAGVTALPMARLFANYGPHYMAASLLIAGILELAFGLARLSPLADVITGPVIAGFLNSLAIFIIQSQLKIFKSAPGVWLTGSAMTSSLVISTISAGLILGFTKIRDQIKIPPQLVAIVVATLLSQFLHFPIKTLGSFAGPGGLQGGLPVVRGWPAIPWTTATLKIIGSAAVGVAMVCILETLLAGRISCGNYRCDDPDHQGDEPNRSIIGLGIGNLLSAFVGGFGGCGLIPNTLLNGASGGRGPFSVLSYSISMALSVLLFTKALELIPMAALAGLMVTVAINTMEWKESFHLLKHSLQAPQQFLDCMAMIVTTYLCYKKDMGLGVIVGTMIARSLDVMKFIRSIFERKEKPSLAVTELAAT